MAFSTAFADDRSVYVVAADGPMLWYRDELQDGTNGPLGERGWAAGSGTQIDVGWNSFLQIFPVGDARADLRGQSGRRPALLPRPRPGRLQRPGRRAGLGSAQRYGDRDGLVGG